MYKEMCVSSVTYGGENWCIQEFGRVTWVKEATWKILA